MALISSRTGCRTASSAVHFATPQAGLFLQEVLPDAGSTTYKDMLAVLALDLVLERLVFQLNDPDMIPLHPLFSRHFEYTCTM